MRRVQLDYILSDLTKKMVLVAGPRQAGKTWLAQEIAKRYQRPIYLNYDNFLDRTIIDNQNWLPTTDLIILDELYKMPEWKNYLKGVFDTKPSKQHLLVIGSARLEVFYEIGDSLAGRYFLHHLLPFSLAELKQTHASISLDQLLERSGFPEPLLAESELDAARWRLQYTDSLLRSDVLDFETILNVKAMRIIFELLQHRVGSSISYANIARDVNLSPHTVKKYIDILEAIYVVFRVTPFSKNIARSLLKEPKIYFYDCGLVKNGDGAVLENFVAVSLLKHCYAKRDYHAEIFKLHYLRTKDHKEIDFVLVKDEKIHQAIELKSSDIEISSALNWYKQHYNWPIVQIVKNLKHDFMKNNIEIISADKFLKNLFL